MSNKFLLIILILLCIILPLRLTQIDKQCFVCPIKYPSDIVIRNDHHGSGVFASNRNGRRLHQGVDLLADVGTVVYAAKSGKVVCATENKGMGKHVIIQHRDNFITIYGHLSDIFVRKGDYLHQATAIGSVGKTGNARATSMLAHLHFEIRKNGVPLDPLEYF